MTFLGHKIRVFLIAALLSVSALSVLAADITGSSSVFPPAPALNIPPVRARMSPELALQVHDARLQRQARELAEYTDNTIVEAELPQTAQKGRYQLQRMFSAPRSLAFKAVNFVGDGFVKTNVIARMLQSEVENAQKGNNSVVAITTANYKFSYKGVRDIDGQICHVFQVKPRQKRVGLFKGYVYLDVYTAGMRRAEGKMVKSPSFFVKNIEFSQDYHDVDGFDMVTHIHSTADARIIGRAIVDITHNDMQARSIYEMQTLPDPSTPTMRSVSYENQR